MQWQFFLRGKCFDSDPDEFLEQLNSLGAAGFGAIAAWTETEKGKVGAVYVLLKKPIPEETELEQTSNSLTREKAEGEKV